MIPTAYIPTYNGRERLRQVLESLRGQTSPCEVLVVDNGSTDGTNAMVADEFPQYQCLSLSENRGFGRALNQAISTAGSGPILLLNDDVELRPDFVARMVAKRETGAAVVCGILVKPDRTGVIDSAGVLADRRTLMAFDHLEGRPVDDAIDAPAPLGATGGAALYDRAAFNSVGGFDPEIFAYYEDLDLAMRLKSAGYSCVLAPDAIATHARSSTLGNRSAAKYALTGWSRGYLIRRYRVLGSAASLFRTLLYESVVCAGQLLFGRTSAGIRGRIRGWRAAGGLPPRQIPLEGLSEFSFRAAIRARFRRYI